MSLTSGSLSREPSAAGVTAGDHPHKDEHTLHAFGYVQKLDRSLGNFAMFALQYSYLSVLTGIFELFGFGYSFNGPAMVWSYIAVFLGQALVALLLMELAARWPIAGAVYNWSKKLRAPAAAWTAGWMTICTSITTLAAVALAAQIVLPAIWTGFQIVGDGSTPASYSQNAVLLGGLTVVATTAINCARVRVVGFINNLAVIAEILGCLLLIVFLFAHAQRGPVVVTNTLGTGHGHSLGLLGAALVASFVGAYQFFGFDTAGSLAEETSDPQRRAPRSILQALTVTFAFGVFLILAALMAIPNLSDPHVAAAGLPFVITSVLGNALGKILLAAVFLAVFGCAVAIQAAGTRMIFGMARDGKLPFSTQLSHVSESSKAVYVPNLVVGAVAVLLLVANVGSAQIVAVVTSLAVITCAIAYLCVTVPMLRARLRGEWEVVPGGRQLFTLGRLGLPVNALAVVWGVLLTTNLLWPRAEVYNATGPHHWYLRFGPILFTAIILGSGLLYYVTTARRQLSVLDEHRREAVPV